MAKTTTNLGLVKPERSDNYSVDVMAGNMDIIDGKLKEHDDILNGGEIRTTETIDAIGGVHGRLYVDGILNTTSGTQYASVTSTTQSLSIPNFKGSTTQTSDTITVGGTVNKLNNVPYPIKISTGIYIKSEDYVYGDVNSVLGQVTRTATLTYYVDGAWSEAYLKFYVNGVEVKHINRNQKGTSTVTHEVPVGSTCYIKAYSPYNSVTVSGSLSISNETKYIYFAPE